MDESLRDRDILYLSPQFYGLLNLPYEPVLWRFNEPLPAQVPPLASQTRLWLLFYLSPDRAEYSGLRGAPGYVYCERVLDRWSALLERWAPSIEDCPVNPLRLEFDQNITLVMQEVALSEDLLRLEAFIRSADDNFLRYHSLTVHVIDVKSGERVAQGDVGVGPGDFVRLASEIDISALPPGGYELQVALYNWQTGERLSARDLETDAISDIHTLHRFQHN